MYEFWNSIQRDNLLYFWVNISECAKINCPLIETSEKVYITTKVTCF